jgi:hypothetical protein
MPSILLMGSDETGGEVEALLTIVTWRATAKSGENLS